MLRKCSNLTKYVKSHDINSLYYLWIRPEGTLDGDGSLRNECEYTNLLVDISQMNNRLYLSLSTVCKINAKGNSDDYIKTDVGWCVKFVKLNHINKSLFKNRDYVAFHPFSRCYYPPDGVSTAVFILYKDGWLAYSQSSNGNLVGEILQIKEVMIPAKYTIDDPVEQKKLSYNFNKLYSLSYYNKSFINKEVNLC